MEQDSHFNVATVRSSFQTIDQPGTLKYARSRCKTCPIIHNVEKISGPKRSIKITEHFTCTSANVINCIACTHCKKLYIGETGRRLGYSDSENTFARCVEKMTRTHPKQSLVYHSSSISSSFRKKKPHSIL